MHSDQFLHPQYSHLGRSFTLQPSKGGARKLFSKSKNATDVLKNLWQHLRLLHYRFEVTYSVYVLDPTEKVVFYILVLLFVAAIFVIMYYPLRYLAYAIVPRSYPLTKTSLETSLFRLQLSGYKA
jgi:hypothetical protein